MRALVVIAHYFKAEPTANYSSTDERQREARRNSIARVLLAWRAHFGESATLNVGHKKLELNAPVADSLDLVVIVNGDDHLLEDELLNRLGVVKIAFSLDQPRMLPFMAQRVMSDQKARYDLFVYSEEDVLPHDGAMFSRLALFQSHFGPARVLQPNRYEINPAALRPKTYVDGDLRVGLMTRLLAMVDEKESMLTLREGAGATRFARAQNPHSGFFALSVEQLAFWSAQKHFLDMDCSFVSPLESAATLGLLKTFSVFKPASPMHFLEIEHLDTKFSNLHLPILLRGEIDAG